MDDDEIRFRTYLAQALGEFEVKEGIDALLKAAETNRDPREQIVRDGAVQAIAVRAYNLQQLDPPQELSNPELQAALARLAADEDPVIRLQTAFALGKIGTPWAIERLETMVGDPHADTRYNAAVGLAVHGNATAIETLSEMLELDDLPSVQRRGEREDSGVQAGGDREQRDPGHSGIGEAESERRSFADRRGAGADRGGRRRDAE